MIASLVLAICVSVNLLPGQAVRVKTKMAGRQEHYEARLEFARELLKGFSKHETEVGNAHASRVGLQNPNGEQSLDDFLNGLDRQEAAQPMMNPPLVMEREHYPQATAMSQENALLTELEEVECEATKKEWEKWAFLCNQAKKGHLETGKTTGQESTEADFQVYTSDENVATNPLAYRDEVHEYHCRAARLNRHRRSHSLISKHLPLPNFPHALGRFQIEGLVHEPEDGAFLKIVAKACGPCKFLGSHERYDGLKEVDIVGFPKFTQKIGYGANTRVGASMKPTPQAMYEYGTWVVTSKHFDDVIRPELEDLAKKMKDAREHSQTEGVKFIDPSQMLPEHAPRDGENFADMPIKLEIQDLLKKLREQEEFIPFNHKAERVDFELYKCNYYKGGLFGKSVTKDASSGQFECHKKETLHLHDGQLISDSAMEPTTDFVKPSHSTSDKASSLTKNQIQGLHFSKYKTEIKGPIDWEVTVPPAGHCAPMTSRYLYFGMGVDSDCDLDLGVVFWKLGRDRRTLSPVEKINFRQGAGVKLGGLVEYSGDNRNGAGEGDDEFMIIDMEKMKSSGYDYATIVVNIYEGDDFSELEGAFMRFVSGSSAAFEKASVETLHYLDLDELGRGAGNKRAAVVAMLFAKDPQNLAMPAPKDSELILDPVSIQKLPGGGNDWHYQLASVKHTAGGNTLDKTVPDLVKWLKSLALPSKQEKLQNVPDMTKDELGQPTIIQGLPDFQHESFMPNPVSGNDPNDQWVNNAASQMGDHALSEALLIEFPSGPPGTDLLCYKQK